MSQHDGFGGSHGLSYAPEHRTAPAVHGFSSIWLSTRATATGIADLPEKAVPFAHQVSNVRQVAGDRELRRREGLRLIVSRMGASGRAFDHGTRRGRRALISVGDELRTARLTLGLSQRDVAAAAHISRPIYGSIERGSLDSVPLLRMFRIAAVLGLELSARVYPGGIPTRDAAHGTRLARLLTNVGAPLRHQTDVPLPATTDHPERRAWDAMLWGQGERTAIELETRLYDIQAQVRRIHLKERDDPPDHFLLVVADTRANRRVLADFADLMPDLPRLRTANALKTLQDGRHPSTGFIVL